MNRHRSKSPARRGFTLIELLVVVLIVVIVGAATIKVAVFDLGGRQVSEAARMLQASLVGARDAAYRANAPRGIRLLPDPEFNGSNTNGNAGALAANRMISIEAAPDYNTGAVTVLGPSPILNAGGTPTGATGFLGIQETTHTNLGTTIIPNEPTSWYWNIRQGDKIRIGDTGRYYTIAGPTQLGAYNVGSSGTKLYNVERYVNFGLPGYVQNPVSFASVQNNLNPANSYDFTTNPNGTHFSEFIQVVNGQDDDGDGWIDEGFDGIDNDGDGIIDPGYNGIDDDGDGTIDNPLELLWSLDNTGSGKTGYNGGEYEPEQFVGAEFNSPNISGEKNLTYTIARRPVVSEGAREVALPQGVVIDLTTWNATGARDFTDKKTPRPTLPERSRLPVDPYSLIVDILLGPDGQVITSTPGQSAGALGGGMASFPTSNMPFYQFWIAEREDVYDPINGTVPVVAGVLQSSVPLANSGYTSTPPQVNLLPMPQGAVGEWITPGGNGSKTPVSYTPPTANGPYLKGDMRLVTLFVKTGQVLTYDLGLSDFDPTDTNQPYMQTRFGTREAK